MLRRAKFYLLTSVFAFSVLFGVFGIFGAGFSNEVSFVPSAYAESVVESEAKDKPLEVQVAEVTAKSFKYIAAGLCVALCGLGTAIAQSRIGAAGAGVIAERPEAAAMCIVLLAIPETIVILGFVVAAMLIVM